MLNCCSELIEYVARRRLPRRATEALVAISADGVIARQSGKCLVELAGETMAIGFNAVPPLLVGSPHVTSTHSTGCNRALGYGTGHVSLAITRNAPFNDKRQRSSSGVLAASVAERSLHHLRLLRCAVAYIHRTGDDEEYGGERCGRASGGVHVVKPLFGTTGM